MTPIQFAGNVTRDDYLKALQLNYRRFRALKWLSGGLFALIVLSFLITGIQTPSSLIPILRAGLPGLVFFLVFLTFPWWIPYLQLSSYNQKGNIYNGSIRGTVDERGIFIRGESVEAVFQWKTFTCYQASGDVLLLYQGKNSINIFTKTLFHPPQDWEAFLNTVKDRLPSR